MLIANQRVVITGAKGMLGAALTKTFSAGDLTVLDRDELDITNESAVMRTMKELRPRVVINAAAYNNVDQAEKESDKADALNGYAVSYLARACRRLSAVFVHYGTDYVFDGLNKRGYDESASPNPINAYGRSKLLGERLLTEQGDKHYLIRVSRLFGHQGSSPLAKKSFVDLMLELSQTKDRLEVVDEEVSAPTFVNDVARHTSALITEEYPFGVYHLANTSGCTWYQFAQEIFRQANRPVKLIPVPSSHYPRPAQRPAYSVLLSTKFHNLRPWQEALGEYLELINPSSTRKNGKK